MLIENAIIIPARLYSTRLPKKLLLEYKGKPLIQHAVEQALKSEKAEDIILLPDSHEIVNAIDEKIQEHKNFSYCMIPEAENGTHRLQQFINLEQNKGNYFRNIVLLQADIMNCDTGGLADMMFNVLSNSNEFEIETFSYPLDRADWENESIVKLLPGDFGVAQYFTRKYVPGARKHIGIYGFANILMNRFDYIRCQDLENLEQMSWIRDSKKIGFSDLGHLKSTDLGQSIDTISDYEELIKNGTINTTPTI